MCYNKIMLFLTIFNMDNHKYILRELAKFAAGLIVGDFLVLVWMATGNIPVMFWGVTFSTSFIAGAMVFDLILIAMLIHYGWHAEVYAPSVNQRTFFLIAGTLLTLVAVLHFVRVIFQAPIILAGWQVPMWLSWIGTLVAGFLGYTSFKFAQTKK